MSNALRMALIALAVLACGNDAPSADRETRTPPGTPIEIAAESIVQVGSAEGGSGQVLHRVTNPALLDGRLVIPMADGRIQVHDKAGRLVESLGGTGKGPGEFEWLTSAWLRGDTLEAYDAPMQRITQFAPDGSVAVVRLENVSFMPSAKGPVNDGWILGSIANAAGERPQRSRDTLVLRHHGLDGGHTGEIHRIPALARYLNSEGRHLPEPLSPAATVRTHEGQIYVGETLQPSIKVLDGTGRVVREFSWSGAGSLSPREAFEAVKERALASAESDQLVEERTRFQNAPTPERLSVWWDFLVDELGFVWVRPYEVLQHANELGGWRGAGPGGEWLVLGPDGSFLATVEVPTDLEPAQITVDAVVGISRDDLGVESVRVHPLSRAGGPQSDR